jgi:hypothetical protein
MKHKTLLGTALGARPKFRSFYSLAKRTRPALRKVLAAVFAHPEGTPAAAEVFSVVVNVANRAFHRSMLVFTYKQAGVATVAFDLCQSERAGVGKS